MSPQIDSHPSQPHLAALALGKLKPAVVGKVQSHVDECVTCATFVRDTPREQLRAVLQSARGATAADRNTHITGNSGTIPGLPPAPTSELTAPQSSSMGAARDAGGEIPADLLAQTKYRVIRLVGRGGMGSVYEAKHIRMNRKVAIKVINPELVDHPQALERFEKETRACSAVDHPNIVRAFDAESFGALQTIVMEFISGQTLDELIEQRGKLSVVEACRCVRQALMGLQHAHERGLVHRDLKPGNLMITRDTGVVKILDFGLGKAVSETVQSRGVTQTNATMGTCEYMAPEQALDAAKADIRADIYSLGCTLYYLIAGTLPFEHATYTKLLLAHQQDFARPLAEACPGTPKGLSDLVDRMLAKSPADRPQTPREAAEALTPYAKGEEPRPAAFAKRELMPETKWLVRWSSFAAAALLAILGGAWALGLLSVKTPNGTILIEGAPEDAEITIDGEHVRVVRRGDALEISAASVGPHHLRLLQNGQEMWSDDVTISVGGEQVRITYTPAAPTDGVAPLSHEGLPDSQEPSMARGDLPPTANLPLPTAEGQGGASASEEGFIRLFNGRDLAGWKTHPGQPGRWSVRGGGLIGTGPAISGLYTLRDDYADVHVKMKIRMSQGTRCGLYVRSGYGPKYNGTWLSGLETVCNSTGIDAQVAGSMFANASRVSDFGTAPLPANKSILLEVITQGNTFTAAIDGKEMARYIDDRNVAAAGHIALLFQQGEVVFESVEVKELSPSTSQQEASGPQRPSDRTAEEVEDFVRVGSVWQGRRIGRRGAFQNSAEYSLYVTGRFGETFTGHTYHNGPRRNRSDVEGSIDGTRIRWTERARTDSTFVTGTLDSTGRTIDLTFTREWTNGATQQGDGQLSINPVDSESDAPAAASEDADEPPKVKYGPPVARTALKVEGPWAIDGDDLVAGANSSARQILFGDPSWTDYDFSYEVWCESLPASPKGLIRRGETNGVHFGMGMFGGSQDWTELGFVVNGRWNRDKRKGRRQPLEPMRWYAIRVEARGSTFVAYVDGQEFLRTSRDGFTEGCVGFGANKPGIMRFRNVAVTAPDGTILWEGLPDPPNS